MMIDFDGYTIRPLEPSDLEPYFALVERNRKRLEDFFTGTVSRTKDLAATAAFLQELNSKRSERLYFPFLLLPNSTQLPIGFFDLKNIDWAIPKAELGCYTDVQHAGTGLTTRAMQLFTSWCFAHFAFKKIFLRTHPGNKAAQAVAEKCGFTREGLIRMDYKTTAGEIVDLLYYGRLAGE